MIFSELAKARYSCRKYLPKPVETEKLEQILEAAQAAPTGVNAQPFHLLVVNTPESIAKLETCSPNVFQAGTAIVILGEASKAWTNDIGMSICGIDVGIVATHMALQATELGLATCMVGRFDSMKLRETFAIPENYTPMLMLPIGYPAPKGTPSERHFKRKAIDELASFNEL